MGNWLVVFGRNELASVFDWRLLNDSGKVSARGVSQFHDLSSIKHDKFVLVLPGQQISSFRTKLAAKNSNQLRSIAPYAIEDEVGSDVEDLHVSVGYSDVNSQSYSLNVISHQDMINWQSALQEQGISPEKVIPDFYCLPFSENSVSCAHLNGTKAFRYRHWGASFDQDSDDALIQQILEYAIQVYGEEDKPNPIQYDDLTQDDQFHLDLMAQKAITESYSLLQGRYENRKRSNANGLNNWLLPIGSAVAALIVSIVFNIVQGNAFEKEAKTLRAAINQEIQRVFPDVRRIVNPRAQLKSLTASNGKGSEFLQLSGLISASVNEVEGISVEALRFDARRGEMQASIIYENYEELSRFKQIIENLGGKMREGGSRQVGNRRSGEITVTL